MSFAGLQPDLATYLSLMPCGSWGWDGQARHQHPQLSNRCLPASSARQHWDCIWVLWCFCLFGGILNQVCTSFGDCIRSFDNHVDSCFSSHRDCLSIFLANERVLSTLEGFPLRTCLLYTEGYAPIIPNNDCIFLFQ